MHIHSQWFLSLYIRNTLTLKYRHTYLGFLWNFLEPALYLIVLSFVFSAVNRMQMSDYAVYLFSALVPWRYLENAVMGIMESIVGGEWLIKKIKVSPYVFPLTRWIVACIEFSFSLFIVILIFAIIKKTWTIHMLVLPFSIIPWSLTAVGLGMICSVLYVFFRDIKPIVQMVLILGFFSSPILFMGDLFEAGSHQALLLSWHPITYYAALFQKPVYYLTWPDGKDWIISITLSICSICIGYYLCNRHKSKFYFYI